jgi:aminotransferase
MNHDPKRHIARHIIDLPTSGIRDFFAVVEKIPDAISLGIGEPDFVTPWHIREAAIFALERGKTSYTNNLGLLKLRRAISSYVRRLFDLEYNPENEIIVAVGVSEALDLAMRALLNPGDKLLYHQPCYVSYHPSAVLCHARPIPVGTSAEDRFCLDPVALRSAWEPGCKMLLLNFPTNPTGAVADLATLQAIARFAQEKDLIVLTDEVYAELTYSGKHVSLASLPGMKERTVFLHGVSKAFAMTGFRIGYACAPAPIIEAMMKVHQYSMMCAPILSQEAAVEALTNGDDEVKRMRDSYERRRDFIVRRFNEIGLPCHLPQGTFYAFPRVDTTGLDERNFALKLLQKAKVAVVPGTAFGSHGSGFCRASFSTSYERLLEATERIERFVNAQKSLRS